MQHTEDKNTKHKETFSPAKKGDSSVRQAILASGLALFSQYGYTKTSIREIATRAKTTIPMIYYYFDNKQGLYTYLLQECTNHLLQSITPKQPIPPQATVTDRLKWGLESFLTFCQQNRSEIQLIFGVWFGGELPPGAPSVVNVYLEMVRRIAALLEEGVKRGEFRPVDCWESSQALVGIMTNFVARMLIGDESFDPASHAQQTTDLLIRGLGKQQFTKEQFTTQRR